MNHETPSYIMTECERTGEFMLTTGCHRAAALARALCRRVARPNNSVWRYYFTAKNAARWRTLLDGGWSVIIRNGQKRFTRDPKPRGMYEALGICRGNGGAL